MKPPKCVALIGYGGISRTVLHELKKNREIEILNVLVREDRLSSVESDLPVGTSAISDPEEIDPSVTLVVEAAGQAAVGQYAPTVLASGRDLAIVSTGALCDDSLLKHLRALAAKKGRRLHALSGALGGLDALAAAKCAGLRNVRYTGVKPPQAWVGTLAESKIAGTNSALVIFEGNARDATKTFPKNANVAATIALTGIGFDKTSVTLISDPNARENSHLIEAEGKSGTLRCEVKLTSMKDNPKTSLITAYSVVYYLKTGLAALAI